MSEAEAIDPGGRVTIGLIDGRTRSGRMGKFSPYDADLTIEADAAVDGKRAKELLPAERVAYVAWHRVPREPPSKAPPGATRYKVHAAGRRSFVAEARIPDDSNAVGFVAYAPTEDAEHRKFFFYHHGVSARERDMPLGTMLVDAGAIGAQALDDAIAKQKQARTVPIGQILIEQRKVTPSDIERAAALQERRKLRIGEILAETGLATKDDIDAALAEQRKRKGRRLGEVLVEMRVVSEETLARTLARKFDLPFVDLSTCALSDAAASEVPQEVVAKYGVLPLDADERTLTVAISDPLALDAIDVLRFHTKKRIDEVLVTPTQLKGEVAAYLARESKRAANRGGDDQPSFVDILKQLNAAEDVGAEEEEDGGGAATSDNAGIDGGIVSLVNQMIADACRRGASDIHVEPNGRERPMTIRFRVDGDCDNYQEVPAAHRAAVVARIKVMAKLDISERRKPQDGKIKFRLGDRQVELRVATIPTSGGEDVVMRILAGSKPLPLEKLKLSERNLAELKKLVVQPYGLLLCVGPTGSGKTTTLHSALGAINQPDTKIWTAEDPVEITQPGLRQVQVNARIGFTFAHAMRAFLRADPDVIMVGEMRDQETASTAIEASLTGHLVLSTLHTNSAPETVTRLLDMGLDPFSFADALLGVLAQRLARALCKTCKSPRPATPAEAAQLETAYGGAALLAADVGSDASLSIWTASGCEECGGTGYKGRIGLHELLVTDDAIRRAVAHKSSVEEIRSLARANGMRTLAQDGVWKALAGETDLKQVLAVCSK